MVQHVLDMDTHMYDTYAETELEKTITKEVYCNGFYQIVLHLFSGEKAIAENARFKK